MRPRFLAATAVLLAVATLSLSAGTTPSEALTCKNVGKRFQVCGDVKPFKSFTAGFGIRFNKSKPGFKSG